MEAGSPIVSGQEALDAFVSAAAEAPAAAALLCDIDGTISPIAPRPADAHVPEAFRELLSALVEKIGLVAFVTGRSLEDGRRMIPLEGAAYIGTHGLETRAADGSITGRAAGGAVRRRHPRGRGGGGAETSTARRSAS